MLDLSRLTLGEIAKIEELSGQPVAALNDDDRPKGLALAAIALIAKRRSGFPEFTWNEAQNLTMDEVTELLGLDEPAEEDDSPKAEHDGSEPRTSPGSSSESE